jgi:1,4-alpha-glucan branching enzyme
MARGYLAIVLHAHLPFVRHPEYDSFLEERWFFEAMTETYIPIVKILSRLAEEKVSCRITISLSPPLLAMMDDPLMQERYRSHVVKLIELAEKEQDRNRWNGHFEYLAGTYRQIFAEALALLDSYQGNLVTAFRRLQKAGVVDLITTSATHAVLPLLSSEPRAIRAQVHAGVDAFTRSVGSEPRGFWLPECSYVPGVEEFLNEKGIRYFFIESHGIEHASRAPAYGVYAPLYTECGVAAFGRDQASTEEVWSARKGFPGDPVYREFYRDIGHELDFSYIKPYIAGDIRVDTGIKYWRITGPRAHKDPYDPYWAREKAAVHAGIFMDKRIRQVEHLASTMATAPIVVAPFDAELFGHWWYEGPQWLDFLIRKMVYDQKSVELISPLSYLERHPVHQRATPATSSWGHKGTFEIWCNGKTDWILSQNNECVRRLVSIVSRVRDAQPSPEISRALNQCVRELFLAQSSDWPFIISNGTSVQYATRRVKDHVSRFHFLADAVEKNEISMRHLESLEYLDRIFPEADYRIFA